MPSFLSFLLVLSSVNVHLRAAAASAVVAFSSYPLQRTPDGGAYLINITFPGHDQTLPMQLDLSSPTTWVNTDTTFCWSLRNLENLLNLTKGDCGVTFSGEIASNTPVPAYWYFTSNGGFMIGKHSVEDIGLGSFQVSDQDLILADQSWILPNEVSAGVLGLAYPEGLASSPVNLLSPSPISTAIIPSAVIPVDILAASSFNFDTTVPDGSSNASFLANLFHQHANTATNQITPVIGLAVSRDLSGANNAGFLTIGNSDVPNPNMNVANATFISFPILTSSFSGTDETYNDTSMQYTITVSGLTAQNATSSFNALPFNATNGSSSAFFPQYFFVSTSDTVISLPPYLAAQINGMFDPPGIPAGDGQTYYVYCDAVAPSLSLIIKGASFPVNPLDLKRHASNSLCISTITADLDGTYVLGDAFLRNVLLVLDFRSTTMYLASRPHYTS